MPIPSGVCRVTFAGRLPSGELFNVSHWMDEDIASEEEATNLAESILDLWGGTALPVWRSFIPSSAAYERVLVYAYTGGEQAAYVGQAQVGSQGVSTSVEALLPLQSSMVISLGTARAGRSGRGRMYLPCIALFLTAHQIPLGVATGVVNATDSYFTELLADMPTQRGPAIVVSRLGTGTHTRVTDISVDTRVDVQRRRAESQNVTGRAFAQVG